MAKFYQGVSSFTGRLENNIIQQTLFLCLYSKADINKRISNKLLGLDLLSKFWNIGFGRQSWLDNGLPESAAPASVMRLRELINFQTYFKITDDIFWKISFLSNLLSFMLLGANANVDWAMLYKFWVIGYNVAHRNICDLCTYEAGGVFSSVSKRNDIWRSKK